MSDVNAPKWLRIDLDCPEALLEPVTDLLGILSGSGVEQRPVKNGKSRISGFFAINDQEDHTVILTRLQEELAALFAIYDVKMPELTTSFMADQDWATSWQQFFKPFTIIPGLVIKPGWEDYEQAEDEQVIEMDPGMAFGTGKHASTRLALQLLHSCLQEQPGKTVLDVGTGTGILAMAACLFGAHKVIAIDNDPEAVTVCTANTANNDLAGTISCSATALEDITETFDLICANIIYNVLVAMLPDFYRLLNSGGQLILAGILEEEQQDNIMHLAVKKGFSTQKILHEDEWSGILLVKHPATDVG